MQRHSSSFVETDLYKYTLRAVCTPLRTTDVESTVKQLALHVAHLFSVDPKGHEEKYMRAVKMELRPVVLCVNAKIARYVRKADRICLSDPYCILSIGYEDREQNDSDEALSSSAHNFQIVSFIRSKQFKTFVRSLTVPNGRPSRKKFVRSHSIDVATLASSKNIRLESIAQCKALSAQTINPEWSEHFEFSIENVSKQYLLITIYDSKDHHLQNFRKYPHKKHIISNKLLGMGSCMGIGLAADSLLGQVKINIESLSRFDGEQWFTITAPNTYRSNNTELLGEILLGLKVHFKLDDLDAECFEENTNTVVKEFHRRNSSKSINQTRSSIIRWDNILGNIFHRISRECQDPTDHNTIGNDLDTESNSNVLSLTPSTNSNVPLLIEKYHQLTRIVMLHATL